MREKEKCGRGHAGGEDRKKHRVGKKNALKLRCSLSCCVLLLSEGVQGCYTHAGWPRELHPFVSQTQGNFPRRAAWL